MFLVHGTLRCNPEIKADGHSLLHIFPLLHQINYFRICFIELRVTGALGTQFESVYKLFANKFDKIIPIDG